MAEFSKIQLDLEEIEIEFSCLVEKISKSLLIDNTTPNIGPKYNAITMTWETDDLNLDWGAFEDVKEDLNIDLEAFIVPVLNYHSIQQQ